jgi:hypothetical protein
MIAAECQAHFGAADAVRVLRTSLGNGPSWVFARDLALEHGDDEVFYLVEDDYLHLPDATRFLMEGLERADYVSLYDHPDKYLPLARNGNVVVDGGGEVTRLIRTASTHWKHTHSTTMTFAARVGTLRADKPLFAPYVERPHPNDFRAFVMVIGAGRTLLTPVPARSTHGEIGVESPLVDWRAVAAAAQ